MAEAAEAPEQPAPSEGEAPAPEPTDTEAPPAEAGTPPIAEKPQEAAETPAAEPTAEGEAPTPEAPPAPSASKADAGPSPSKEAAVEPSPSKAAAVEPSPSKAAAVEPSPSKAAAVEPSPSKAEAVEPSPSKAAAVEPSPSKAAPVETSPSKTAGIEPTPSKVAAVEPSPSKSAAVEPSPSKAAAAAPAPSKDLSAAPTPSKEVAPPAEGAAPADAAPKPSGVVMPSAEKIPGMERSGIRSKQSLTAASRASLMASQKALQDGRGRTSSRMSLASVRESLMRLRRPSGKAWHPSGSFISFRRSSLGFDKMKTLYENTYQLDAFHPFSTDQVSLLLADAVEDFILPEHYDPDGAVKITQDVVKVLRSRIKDLNYDRCRMICICEMVEKRSQVGAHGLRFLWDSERDRFASYSVERPTYYLIAVIFGVYTD